MAHCKTECAFNQGRNCDCSLWATRRVLGLNTKNSTGPGEKVDTDEPPARFEDAAGWVWLVIWTLAVFVAVGLFAVVVRYAP